MSTILDALKKSEQERKLNKVPTLADMPTPREPSRWPLYLGSVIIVLLVVLTAVLLSGRFVVDSGANQADSRVINNDSLGLTGEGAAADREQDIIVNVVSYSEAPEQRFVMINGKMFRENEFVRAGLKVVKIRQDSVELNNRGQRLIRKP